MEMILGTPGPQKMTNRAIGLRATIGATFSSAGPLQQHPAASPHIALLNLQEYSTMKLDAKAIRYLTSEDFRVLSGVRSSGELGTYECPLTQAL